jgi:hypothetical protein
VVLKQRVKALNRTQRLVKSSRNKRALPVTRKQREVKNLVGPVGKAAAVRHHRDKKDDDKKDNDVIEHKGAAVVAHRRR